MGWIYLVNICVVKIVQQALCHLTCWVQFNVRVPTAIKELVVNCISPQPTKVLIHATTFPHKCTRISPLVVVLPILLRNDIYITNYTTWATHQNIFLNPSQQAKKEGFVTCMYTIKSCLKMCVPEMYAWFNNNL